METNFITIVRFALFHLHPNNNSFGFIKKFLLPEPRRDFHCIRNNFLFRKTKIIKTFVSSQNHIYEDESGQKNSKPSDRGPGVLYNQSQLILCKMLIEFRSGDCDRNKRRPINSEKATWMNYINKASEHKKSNRWANCKLLECL